MNKEFKRIYDSLLLDNCPPTMGCQKKMTRCALAVDKGIYADEKKCMKCWEAELVKIFGRVDIDKYQTELFKE